MAAHFAKRNTKFGGGKRGRAKIPSPPTPFLFARPSVQFGARSAPSVPLKKGSDFVKQTHQNKNSPEHSRRAVFVLVPGVGFEPTTIAGRDFKSPA